MVKIKKAILRSFDAGTYRADIEITGSRQAYLENIAVARNLSTDELVNGRQLAVIFFDEHNAREAVVVAVYT